MNKTNMLRVADSIESENLAKFDMRVWHGEGFEWNDSASPFYSSCGTVACVGGTAMAIMASDNLWRYKLSSKDHVPMSEGNVQSVADWLGLSYREAHDLFSASEIGTSISPDEKYRYVNERKHLVPDALRYMAETGDTSWIKGFEYAECVQQEKNKK